MEEYLKLLKRKLVRNQTQLRLRGNEALLSRYGMWGKGYEEGRISILEDVIDEIEDYLKGSQDNDKTN